MQLRGQIVIINQHKFAGRMEAISSSFPAIDLEESMNSRRIHPVAHIRESDGREQSVFEHLTAVGNLSKDSASKIGLELPGELIGLVHDLGKYSDCFQNYLLSAVGLLNQDVDEAFVDFEEFRGKIDHSTAGAQWIWNTLSQKGVLERITAQILAICIASHHSGLIDCISASGNQYGSNTFLKRMQKPYTDTHLNEAMEAAPDDLVRQFTTIVSDMRLSSCLQDTIKEILQHNKGFGTTVASVHTALLVRFLFSCLIDADRVDTADFENPEAASIRQRNNYPGWSVLVDRLENRLAKLQSVFDIDKTRNHIAAKCLDKSQSDRGIYSLSVPTGGGKTFASLRFGLHHAAKHELDRVVYVIPYTSIIDQNAKVVRKAIELKGEAVVLEHHSNLSPQKQGFREKILSENWDAPVVFTTMVQFLESLFGSGTRGARRMHQLANSVIIFDEIQSLPIKCVHLFNNAVNFLVEQCNSTAVLCTATQPLLHTVDKSKGSLKLEPENEIVSDVSHLYRILRRTQVINLCKPGGWQDKEIANLAIEQTQESGSSLVVVNTKQSARSIYEHLIESLPQQDETPVYHLSTNMCPAHRKLVLHIIKKRLDSKLPVVCVSTQLIEAGVDIDFGSAIRFLAGLDSIAQTAGRCNRNGFISLGKVFIVNPANENLSMLPNIQVGVETTNRILQDYSEKPGDFDNDLIGRKMMTWYFENYFYKRANEMDFPVPASNIGHDDTILNLLSQNSSAVGEYLVATDRAEEPPLLRQAFMTAGRAFEVIEAPTRGVIVPHGRKGKELVAQIMAAEYDFQFHPLLRRAQQFTVNVFPYILNRLKQQQAVYPINLDIDIYCLQGQYYDKEFGLADEPASPMEFLNA